MSSSSVSSARASFSKTKLAPIPEQPGLTIIQLFQIINSPQNLHEKRNLSGIGSFSSLPASGQKFDLKDYAHLLDGLRIKSKRVERRDPCLVDTTFNGPELNLLKEEMKKFSI